MVESALKWLDIDEFNSRAGYRPGFGYLDPAEAADEILDAVLEFRRAAEANGVTWLGLARQQLARECKLTHPCPTVLCHGQGCARSGGAETRRLG